MVRIVIKTKTQLDDLRRKLRAVNIALPKIQSAAMNEVANDVVLDEIHRKMRREDFSEKIIDATFVGPTEISGPFMRTHFISNYESEDGFDVSNAREEGTFHPNPTFPKKEGGTLRWFAETGEPIFRKRSHPKGIERLLIIEKTIRQFENRSLNLLGDKMAEKIKGVLGV